MTTEGTAKVWEPKPREALPEIARHIGEFVCLCGKEHTWDSASVFRTDDSYGLGPERPNAGWLTCRVCECKRQWNVSVHTYLREGGIVETRTYVRLTKDLEKP